MLAPARLCLLWLPAQAAALNAFFAAAGPKSAPKQQLLDLCKDSNYGATPIDRDRLDELIDELATVNPNAATRKFAQVLGQLETALDDRERVTFCRGKGALRGRALRRRRTNHRRRK